MCDYARVINFCIIIIIIIIIMLPAVLVWWIIKTFKVNFPQRCSFYWCTLCTTEAVAAAAAKTILLDAIFSFDVAAADWQQDRRVTVRLSSWKTKPAFFRQNLDWRRSAIPVDPDNKATGRFRSSVWKIRHPIVVFFEKNSWCCQQPLTSNYQISKVFLCVRICICVFICGQPTSPLN